MSKSKRISDGTKKGLAAAKDRGQQLGTPNLTDADRRAGAARRKQIAEDHYRATVDRIRQLKQRQKGVRDRGLRPWTNGEVAEQLNDEGFRTATGQRHSRTTVKRLIDRYIPKGELPEGIVPYYWLT